MHASAPSLRFKGSNRYAILDRIGAVKTPVARARKIARFVAMPRAAAALGFASSAAARSGGGSAALAGA